MTYGHLSWEYVPYGLNWRCAWASCRPGMIVVPAASTTVAPLGIWTLPEGPTAAIRSPVTTIVPRSITSSPRMVTSRAFVNATVPRGTSRGNVIATAARVSTRADVSAVWAVVGPGPAGIAGAPAGGPPGVVGVGAAVNVS